MSEDSSEVAPPSDEPTPTPAPVSTPEPTPAGPTPAPEPATAAPMPPPAPEAVALTPPRQPEAVGPLVADLTSPPVAPTKPKRRWRKIVLVSAIVLTLLVGIGVVGAGMYVRSVALPEPLRFPSNTTLYYRDGSVLARLGEVRRTELPAADITDEVRQVAVAAEDPDFWTDSGGAIARSVARMSYDIAGDSRSARLRVVVAAHKMEDQRPKEQVLAEFLNDSAFGRVTYGIEAAAQEYFGKTANARAPQEERLSLAEAMVLLAMVRQPNPDPDDPQGSPGFDPTRGQRAEENSRSRFQEIRDSMVSARYLTAQQASALTYPTNVRPYDAAARQASLSQPVGLIVNHVLSELTHGPASPLRGLTWREIVDGGYKIYTTIDPGVQEAVARSADAQVSGSVMSGQPVDLQAAAVVVEPGTGRVLGYFGGSGGDGPDYAGVYVDEKGDTVGFGAHAPGGTFMVHTLAAALKAGISLNSYWSWQPHDMPGRTGTAQVRNASMCPSDQNRSGACSLLDSTSASLNVPFYGLTVSVTPAKVLEMARAAGIDTMWTDTRERVDLTKQTDLTAVTPSKFDTVLGLGQYLGDRAGPGQRDGHLCRRGTAGTAHFVSRVMTGDHIVYGEELPTPTQPRVLDASGIADLDYALSRSSAGQLVGRDSASKTGSWEYSNRADKNSQAWIVGYTGNLAMAVWIGGRAVEHPLVDSKGATIWGSGLPATIYRNVMTSAHGSMALRPVAFPPPALAGNANPPGSVPAPSGNSSR